MCSDEGLLLLLYLGFWTSFVSTYSKQNTIFHSLDLFLASGEIVGRHLFSCVCY
jgi:hypothetical protein